MILDMGISYQILLFSFLFRPCFSWTHGTTVDLAWPPLAAESYATINSVAQPTHNDDYFPCSNQPVNSSTPRVMFPVIGGRLQFNLTNTTDLITYKYIGNIYIGQFSGDTTPARNASRGITTYVWKDFRTRPDCGETVNLTKYVNEAYEMVNRDVNRQEINERDIIGMNATIAIRNVLFSTDDDYDYPGNIYNVEEMYQCGYITIGTPGISTQPGDFCNSKEGPDYIASVLSADVAATATSTSRRVNMPTFTSSTLIPTISASTTSSPTAKNPTATSSTSDGQGSSTTAHSNSLIIGVSVSVGVAIILLLMAVVLFRRRKQRRGTLGPEFIVTRQEGSTKEDKQKEEKKMEEEGAVGKDDMMMKNCDGGQGNVESSGNSVKSEALPVYEK